MKKRRPTVLSRGETTQTATASTTVKMKLNSVLRGDPFMNEFTESFLRVIKESASNMSRIQFLASDLVNFHMLRLLNQGLPLPTLNQTFFVRCCIIVTDTSRPKKDSELNESFRQFRALYPEYQVPKNAHMGTLMNSLARLMVTNFDNHVSLNTPSRVIRYVRFKYSLGKNQAIGFIKRAFTSDVELTSEQLEFKDWCKFFPLEPTDIPKNMAYFVHLSFLILRFLEELPEGTKGRRLFTLAPLKGDYICSNITLNVTTFGDLLALMSPENRLTLLYMIEVEEDIELKELIVKAILNPRRTIGVDLLRQTEFSKEVFRALFNTAQFERTNVKFDGSIKTNGYTACLLFERVIKEASATHVTHVTPKTFKKLISVDPGIGNLVTCCDDEDNTKQVSGGEYRCHAKMSHQKQWENGMRERNPEYQTKMDGMKSMKTANLDVFKVALEYRLRTFSFLFDFCASKPFLKWRFSGYINQNKALTWMTKKVVGGRDKKTTAIGLGDWSQVDGFVKGRQKAPSKRIEKALGNFATVIKVDEFRTSQVCSRCKVGKCHKDDHKLKKAVLKCNKDGEVELVSCYNVLRCLNPECNTFWQRDVNASRNIMCAFKNQVMGLERPEHLRRETIEVALVAPETLQEKGIPQRKKLRMG